MRLVYNTGNGPRLLEAKKSFDHKLHYNGHNGFINKRSSGFKKGLIKNLNVSSNGNVNSSKNGSINANKKNCSNSEAIDPQKGNKKNLKNIFENIIVKNYENNVTANSFSKPLQKPKTITMKLHKGIRDEIKNYSISNLKKTRFESQDMKFEKTRDKMYLDEGFINHTSEINNLNNITKLIRIILLETLKQKNNVKNRKTKTKKNDIETDSREKEAGKNLDSINGNFNKKQAQKSNFFKLDTNRRLQVQNNEDKKNTQKYKKIAVFCFQIGTKFAKNNFMKNIKQRKIEKNLNENNNNECENKFHNMHIISRKIFKRQKDGVIIVVLINRREETDRQTKILTGYIFKKIFRETKNKKNKNNRNKKIIPKKNGNNNSVFFLKVFKFETSGCRQQKNETVFQIAACFIIIRSFIENFQNSLCLNKGIFLTFTANHNNDISNIIEVFNDYHKSNQKEYIIFYAKLNEKTDINSKKIKNIKDIENNKDGSEFKYNILNKQLLNKLNTIFVFQIKAVNKNNENKTNIKNHKHNVLFNLLKSLTRRVRRKLKEHHFELKKSADAKWMRHRCFPSNTVYKYFSCLSFLIPSVDEQILFSLNAENTSYNLKNSSQKPKTLIFVLEVNMKLIKKFTSINFDLNKNAFHMLLAFLPPQAVPTFLFVNLPIFQLIKTPFQNLKRHRFKIYSCFIMPLNSFKDLDECILEVMNLKILLLQPSVKG